MADNAPTNANAGGAADANANNQAQGTAPANGNGANNNTNADANANANQGNAENMIPKSRFDEVNTELKSLKAWKDEQEAKQKQAEEESLKKKGEFETLAKQKEEEAAKLRAELQTERINNRIIAEAQKVGVVDIEPILALIDRSGIKIGDTGVEGVTEAVTKLVEAKPYLKGNGAAPQVGSGTNPVNSGNNPNAPKIKASQLKDPKFYQENHAAIMNAMKLGLIEDDIA